MERKADIFKGLIYDGRGEQVGVIHYSVFDDDTVGGYVILGERPNTWITGFSGLVGPSGTFNAVGENERQDGDAAYLLQIEVSAPAAGEQVRGAIKALTNGAERALTFVGKRTAGANVRTNPVGRNEIVETDDGTPLDASDEDLLTAGPEGIAAWVKSWSSDAAAVAEKVGTWAAVLAGLGLVLGFAKWGFDTWVRDSGKKTRKKKRKKARK